MRVTNSRARRVSVTRYFILYYSLLIIRRHGRGVERRGGTAPPIFAKTDIVTRAFRFHCGTIRDFLQLRYTCERKNDLPLRHPPPTPCCQITANPI